MSIPIQCRECGLSLKVRDALRGKRVKCPDCEATIRVPDRVSSPPASVPKSSARGAAPAGDTDPPAKNVPWKWIAIGAAAVLLPMMIVGALAIGYLVGQSGNDADLNDVATTTPLESPQDTATTGPPDEPAPAVTAPLPAAPEPVDVPTTAAASIDSGTVPPSDAGGADTAPQTVTPAPASPPTPVEPPAVVEAKPEPALPDEVVFAPLPVAETASTVVMSEDGTLLFLANEGSGHVMVWDIAAGETVATIETPRPTTIRCGGISAT